MKVGETVEMVEMKDWEGRGDFEVREKEVVQAIVVYKAGTWAMMVAEEWVGWAKSECREEMVALVTEDWEVGREERG